MFQGFTEGIADHWDKRIFSRETLDVLMLLNVPRMLQGIE